MPHSRQRKGTENPASLISLLLLTISWIERNSSIKSNSEEERKKRQKKKDKEGIDTGTNVGPRLDPLCSVRLRAVLATTRL